MADFIFGKIVGIVVCLMICSVFIGECKPGWEENAIRRSNQCQVAMEQQDLGCSIHSARPEGSETCSCIRTDGVTLTYRLSR